MAKRYIAEGRENLSSHAQHIEFRLQRVSELRETDTFDFALAYWHTIGFMSHKEIQNHFDAVCTALKPRSSFLCMLQGPRLISGSEGQTSRNREEQNGKFILIDKSIRGGFRNKNCFVTDTNTGEVTEYREHQRAISFEDVMQHLQHAGFNRIETFKDFEKNPATPEEYSIFLHGKD